MLNETKIIHALNENYCVVMTYHGKTNFTASYEDANFDFLRSTFKIINKRLK